MDTTRPAQPRSPRPGGSSPTPISRPNINYRQVDPMLGAAQTTSTYDYWWPYPPGGVYATTTTPPAVPLIPTTTNLLAAPQTNIISDVNSVLDLTLDDGLSTSSDSSISTTSSTASDGTSATSINPSVISLTALPPDTTTSAPNSSPKKLDRAPSTTVVKYVVPACVVAGVIVGSLFAWFVYGCLRARRMRLSGGHGEKRRRPRERLEAGTEYRYMPTEDGDEEKALPEAPGDDSVWDDKDYTLDLEDEHALGDLPGNSGARTQRSTSRSMSRGAHGPGTLGYSLDDPPAPATGSFRWPSAPFANAFTKTNKKSLSRANSVADTDVMSLLSHGEGEDLGDYRDTPSKNGRLAANVLRGGTANVLRGESANVLRGESANALHNEPKRRAGHAREQSDLRLEDLGIDLGRPAKYRAKRPTNGRVQRPADEQMQSDGSALGVDHGVHRANTVASSYTVALKTDDGPDERVRLGRSDTRLGRSDTRLGRSDTRLSRATTVKSTYSTASATTAGVSRANTVKSTGGFRIVVESPPTAAGFFGGTPATMFTATPASIYSALPTPTKIMSSLFGSEDGDGERDDRYTPLPQRSRSRSASPVKQGRAGRRGESPTKPLGARGRRQDGSGSGSGSAGNGSGSRSNDDGKATRPSAIARPSHSAMDVLPQSPPLVGSPFLCFDAPPRPVGFEGPPRGAGRRSAPGAGGFGWPGEPSGIKSPEVGVVSPKPGRGPRGGRLVPKGGRGRPGGS
ncbi:hypothetical protein EV121DRAFT_203396 [Schizophyllum commune]